MSERLGIPLFRYGLPIFDRLGAAHRLSVGYRGTRDLIFEIGNMFMARSPRAKPDDWRLPRETAMMARRLRLISLGQERTMKQKGPAV